MQTTLRLEDTTVGYDALVVPRVEPAGGSYYLAAHPELPGCKAHGSTPDEALENLSEALGLYQSIADRTGSPLPSPHSDPRVTIVIEATSTTTTATGTELIVAPATWQLSPNENDDQKASIREVALAR